MYGKKLPVVSNDKIYPHTFKYFNFTEVTHMNYDMLDYLCQRNTLQVTRNGIQIGDTLLTHVDKYDMLVLKNYGIDYPVKDDNLEFIPYPIVKRTEYEYRLLFTALERDDEEIAKILIDKIRPFSNHNQYHKYNQYITVNSDLPVYEIRWLTSDFTKNLDMSFLKKYKNTGWIKMIYCNDHLAEQVYKLFGVVQNPYFCSSEIYLTYAKYDPTTFFLNSAKRSKFSKCKEILGLYEVDVQKIRDSDIPEKIKNLVSPGKFTKSAA